MLCIDCKYFKSDKCTKTLMINVITGAKVYPNAPVFRKKYCKGIHFKKNPEVK